MALFESIAASVPLGAQSATVTGAVTDPGGAVLASANVTLTSSATGISQTPRFQPEASTSFPH